MRLTATKEVRYGGQTYQPGAEFDASDKDGKVLKAIKKAVDAPVAAVRVPDLDPLAGLRSEAEAAGVKVDKRWGEERLKTELATAKAPRVQTRDMAAERVGEEASFRRYRRRDLEAEE